MKSKNKVIYKELSYEIVGVLFEVYNQLGYGYRESSYEKAIAEIFRQKNIKFKEQVPYKISLHNAEIALRYIDLLVEDKIVLELKVGNYFSRKNTQQIKGYLKITNKRLGIIANFTTKDVKTMRILN